MTSKTYKKLPFSGSCAIVAPAKKGTPLSIKKFSNFKSLTDEYGEESKDNPLVLTAKVLFLNKVSTVYCLPPSINSSPTKENYFEAFKILKCTSGFYTIVCDSNDKMIISELVKSINTGSDLPRLVFAPSKDNIKDSFDLAKEVGDKRLILSYSKTFLPSSPEYISSSLTAAAFAAKVSSIQSPLKTIIGSKISGLSLYEEPDINLSTDISNSGLSFLKYNNDKLKIYKLTSSEAIQLKSQNKINRLLIHDIIFASIVNLITKIKKSPGFNAPSLYSLMSQIILLLTCHKDNGLISDFSIPEIKIDSKINISISLKPELLFDNENINIYLSI